jgi:serine/threonine-protein kinase
MALVDATRFLELLKLSRLVSESSLDACLSALSEQDRQDVDKVAQRFVDSKLLTPWQVDNLLGGKHKGFRLGSYRLQRKLGRGGMSTVYLAEHELMRRQAAIKVLPRKRVADSSYLARFHREAQAAAALDHPNIVRIYDVAADGNVHYIAMEFIDGHDLQTLVANDGRLDFDTAADYIAQASLGLQHAHSVGLIHRDIKPANLLANDKGVIKLLDMGLAKFDGDDDTTSLTLEHEENVLGTVDYLAPEQALDSHNVDQRADIYSLGCTFYFLLTGHAPFPEGSLAQRLMKHQKVRPAALGEKRPDTPAALIKICEQMMEKSATERIQSAGAVAEQLGAWLATRGKSITGDSTTGSKIGMAASVIRELANQADDEELLTATATSESTESDRDTTISRSQAETRKSSPPSLMPDELDLARPADEPAKSGSPLAERKVELTKKEQRAAEARTNRQISSLAAELTPFSSSEDELLRGARVHVERRLVSESKSEPGIPVWVWIAGGVGALVAIIAVLAILISMS